jgi:hypothetical protein
LLLKYLQNNNSSQKLQSIKTFNVSIVLPNSHTYTYMCIQNYLISLIVEFFNFFNLHLLKNGFLTPHAQKEKERRLKRKKRVKEQDKTEGQR